MSKIITTQDIREEFLDYFQSQNHLKIDGTSLLPPEDDKTLLFINSGMAPLKNYFTGEKQPPSVRMCNVQSCIRTVDIGDIGDNTHLTFFDMLGNWSIGDYGRQDAIDLASRFVIDRLDLPQASLYASVYAGNEQRKVPFDQESFDAWKSNGFKESQIAILEDEDNFWGPAGETGPCGPCTELFIDNGPDAGASYEESGVFDTERRYTEIWNAGVFMTFSKDEKGQLTKLPFDSVDSGAGLERMTMALNGFSSVYEVGPYPDLISTLPKNLDEKRQRILVDHFRASAHIIADGILPDKNAAGYVVRRLLRRMETIASTNGNPIPYKDMMDAVLTHDGANTPALHAQQALILKAMEAESRSFNNVLKQGMKMIKKHLRNSPDEIDASTAFKLVTSTGMPIESIQQIAESSNIDLDIKGFEEKMEEHRQISRGGAKPKIA